jgi:LCP family protein required for cell wall assembly
MARRRGVIAGAAVTLALATILWWSTPWLVGAQSPTPAVGIHKVEEAGFEPTPQGLLFIAVVGTDVRAGPPGGAGGCDAVHIVAINIEARAGTILNFPRDSFLNGQKLTDICRRGGVEAAVSVLGAHTGIRINYFVTTEFSHFQSFIQELGGMEINVPYAMADSASGAVFQPGPQAMNGSQVLAFTRNRKDTPRGDFSRTENQGLAILASLQKFRTETKDPHRLFDYIRVARRHVKLDVPATEIIRLALVARRLDPSKIQNLTVPGSTGSAGSASVVFLAPGDTYDRVRDDAIF